MTFKCDLNTSLDVNLSISGSLLNTTVNLFYNKNILMEILMTQGFPLSHTAFGSQKPPRELT